MCCAKDELELFVCCADDELKLCVCCADDELKLYACCADDELKLFVCCADDELKLYVCCADVELELFVCCVDDELKLFEGLEPGELPSSAMGPDLTAEEEAKLAKMKRQRKQLGMGESVTAVAGKWCRAKQPAPLSLLQVPVFLPFVADLM